MRTMRAEQGTSITVARKSPARLQRSEMAIERNIMVLNLWQNVSAVICGRASIDISSITPTRRMVRTMHTATSTVIAVDMNMTGSCLTAAKSGSKAQITIFLKKDAMNMISTTVKMANARMSLLLIVRILPKRNVLSSGT